MQVPQHNENAIAIIISVLFHHYNIKFISSCCTKLPCHQQNQTPKNVRKHSENVA